MTDLATRIEKIAYRLSREMFRMAFDGINSGTWEDKSGGHFSTRNPWPMSVYRNDRNLYYARGWGCHLEPTPWERWLVLRALRAKGTDHG